MPPRRFSANYILPINGKPIRNGVIGVDEQGTIIEIIEQQEHPKEYSHTEFRNGIIVPGFVNAHCHTELSHMKGKTRRGGGMAQFLHEVSQFRDASDEEATKCVNAALNEMYREGVAAIGDICNSPLSFLPKQKSPLLFFNFIEILGLRPELSETILDRASTIAQIAVEQQMPRCAITPHSTYSLSEALWDIVRPVINRQELLSVHFAESGADIDFSVGRQGDFIGVLNALGLPQDTAPQGNPLEILKRYIEPDRKLILVHNTHLKSETLSETASHFPGAYFCFCPQSNLFIEQRLPNVPIFLSHSNRLVVGTDSYASSESLSMLEQIRIITANFPSVSFNETLAWATLNGARALGLQDQLGSIAPGKRPGLVLISPFDFANWRLLPQSRAQRLA